MNDGWIRCIWCSSYQHGAEECPWKTYRFVLARPTANEG